MASGDSTTTTVLVAVIGATGTAFSAWLYSRRSDHSPPGPGPTPQHPQPHVKDGVVLDIFPDPLDVDTVTHMARRLRSLERFRRHAAPILIKAMNVFEWEDPELERNLHNEDEDDL